MGEWLWNRSPWTRVLAGGLCAGTLDLAFATGFWAAKGVAPIRILHSIAAGVLGREARGSGTSGALLGVGLHYAIAVAMAAGFLVVLGLGPGLRRHIVAAGGAYGLFLYGLMTFVVVPLSAAPVHGPQPADWIIASILAHVVLVGIPCAWFVTRGRH
jgi:hypothetical protein